MAIETLLLTTVLPAAVDLAKSFFGGLSRRVAGLSVDDQLKLDNAAVERIKAIAELDNPYGTPSQWVVDLRASFRYIAAAGLIMVGAALAGFGAYTDSSEIFMSGLETAGAPFTFIFGERMWQGIKGMHK